MLDLYPNDVMIIPLLNVCISITDFVLSISSVYKETRSISVKLFFEYSLDSHTTI